MNNNTWWQLTLSWVGTVLGHFITQLTLSRLVLLATLIFTVLQIYVLARDKVIRHCRRRKHRGHDKFQ